MQPISDLDTLLAQMTPTLQPGRYTFVCLPETLAVNPLKIVASIREAEGLSAILTEQYALELGLPIAFSAAWITLTVNSDLAAVGLTAAVANALAAVGISCNVVAGLRHDHLFVPASQAQAALSALHALQCSAIAAQSGVPTPSGSAW